MGQVVAHAPFVQTKPGLQMEPHMPQSSGLEARSTQAPLHSAGVTPTVQVQALFTQVWLPAHATPHWPQSSALSVRLTQAPLQSVSPAAHVVAQAPFEQTMPAPHARPQPPQSFGSVVGLTQAPPQDCVPAGQSAASGCLRPPSPESTRDASRKWPPSALTAGASAREESLDVASWVEPPSCTRPASGVRAAPSTSEASPRMGTSSTFVRPHAVASASRRRAPQDARTSASASRRFRFGIGRLPCCERQAAQRHSKRARLRRDRHGSVL